MACCPPKTLGLLLAAAVSMPVLHSYPDAACDHLIYCKGGNGTLLHTVQMAEIYNDSKTFVDKPLINPVDQVLFNFDVFMQDHDLDPGREEILAFVNDNFFEEGNELEEWTPDDWTEGPAFLERIVDPDYRRFGSEIHARWKELGRKIKSDVVENKTSLIPMDNPFIVPGGRFREMYYWDTYWTILGLIQSEMTQTVKGMLENFSRLIDKYGFIPNGNRVYFERRSQPPLFASMAAEYLNATNDLAFLQEHISSLDAEFDFWRTNRTRLVNVGDGRRLFELAFYDVEVDGPRPESYLEDYLDAQKLHTAEEVREYYFNMKSGAESGWDYSTKWLVHPDTGEASSELTHIRARHIAPVDLNAFLCKNAKILARFHLELGDAIAAKRYRDIGKEIEAAIDAVMWDEEEGAWFDFDSVADRRRRKQRRDFYVSAAAPLWAECYPRGKGRARRFVEYLESQEATYGFPGGIPTSMSDSGQQWDFPNAWPPTTEILVTALRNAREEYPAAESVEVEVVRKWVKNNFVTFEDTDGFMFEKYDVRRVGPGSGGEYDVQTGFGWTNGVAISLLARYGDRISPADSLLESKAVVTAVVVAVAAVLCATAAALFIKFSRAAAAAAT